MSSNALTPAQAERLAKLAEECGEVVQLVGKVLIHGYENFHPRKPEEGTNRVRLEEELGNIEAIVHLMASEGDVDVIAIKNSRRNKLHTIWDYLHENKREVSNVRSPF